MILTRRGLVREVRRLRRELDVVSSTHEAMKHLIRCTDPAMHVRLAHQLQQAETRLAAINGADPHTASAPVRFEPGA